MKKLKIFLLLSILLCFGFVLSSEVQAQGDGPKIFEVGDVLPATTQLRITFTNLSADEFAMSSVFSNSDSFYILYNGVVLSDIYITSGPFGDKVYDSPYDTQKYVDINISSLTLEQRTISTADGNAYRMTWEDLNATSENNPKPFEVGDVLPAGYIKITWDFTDTHIGELDIFTILGDSEGDSGLIIEIWNQGDGRILIDINYDDFIANTTGGAIITLTEPITIHSVEGYDGYDYEPLDYYEYIDDALLWEVVSQDYADGYEDGYADAEVTYGLGYGHAREIYGYYDPITEQWLSVSEYLNLYGTDKMGQSDFYNNFDKYFIPAMIIVFGGAIILTILKVFKGRE